MKKLVSFLGVVVALSLGAIAWTANSGVMAGEGRLQAGVCAPGDVSLDEGYGVSRHVERVCAQN
jgi:hypothetical protein